MNFKCAETFCFCDVPSSRVLYISKSVDEAIAKINNNSNRTKKMEMDKGKKAKLDTAEENILMMPKSECAWLLLLLYVCIEPWWFSIFASFLHRRKNPSSLHTCYLNVTSWGWKLMEASGRRRKNELVTKSIRMEERTTGEVISSKNLQVLGREKRRKSEWVTLARTKPPIHRHVNRFYIFHLTLHRCLHYSPTPSCFFIHTFFS